MGPNLEYIWVPSRQWKSIGYGVWAWDTRGAGSSQKGFKWLTNLRQCMWVHDDPTHSLWWRVYTLINLKIDTGNSHDKTKDLNILPWKLYIYLYSQLTQLRSCLSKIWFQSFFLMSQENSILSRDQCRCPATSTFPVGPTPTLLNSVIIDRSGNRSHVEDKERQRMWDRCGCMMIHWHGCLNAQNRPSHGQLPRQNYTILSILSPPFFMKTV